MNTMVPQSPTNASLKQVMIQSQHWRAYSARSDNTFIMRRSSVASQLWLGFFTAEVLGLLRWRGWREDTRERNPSVSCDGVSFP